MVDPRFKARIEAYYRAFNARAEDAYLACFRPDGAVGGTLTGTPVSGVGVQKAILRTACGGLGDLMMSPVTLYQAQSEVMVVWAGEVRAPSGGRTPVHGITLFDFDEDAKIRLAQVFWNPRALTGVGPADSTGVDPHHREAIEAYFEGFNGRDWTAVGLLFTEEGSFGGTLAGPGLRGEATLRAIYESAVSRFPEIRMRPLEAFQAQGDVAAHWEGRAIGHDGLAQDIRGISLFRFAEDGRIARYRIYWNPRPLLEQA